MQGVQYRTGHSGVLSAIIALLILSCLTCAGFLGYYVFQVQTIEVQGNHLFSADEIIGLSGVQKGDNLFAVSAEKVKEGLASQPFLSLVNVERKWPSTILLDVSERKAIAAIAFDNKYILIAEDGTALQVSTDPQGLAIVKGLGVTASVIGAKVQGASGYQLYVMDQLCAQILKSSCKQYIAGINLQDPASVVVDTNCGITIRLGTDENMSTKFGWVESLLPRLVEEGKNYGTLDVTGASGASYIP